MIKSKMGRSRSLIPGYIIGGLVGAVITLLVTPKSGEQMRTLIRDKSNEFKDKAVSSMEEMRSRAEERIQLAQYNLAEDDLADENLAEYDLDQDYKQPGDAGYSTQ